MDCVGKQRNPPTFHGFPVVPGPVLGEGVRHGRQPSRTASCRARSLLAAALLLLAACAGTPVAGNAVSIEAIQGDPRTWVGRRVVIEGQVTHTMSLVLARYFTLDDGTGTMTVLTDRPLPARGQRMRVSGKVSDFFSLGSEGRLVLMEDPGESDPALRATMPSSGSSPHAATVTTRFREGDLHGKRIRHGR